MEILKVFNTLTLRQIFWKTKTFFKKLEYHFLVENTKIENASFPYRTALSEANVKTNRMVTTKERIFASNCFIFLKFCFSLRTSYKELILCTNNPNAHIHIFCKRWTFTWRCFFSMSIHKCINNVYMKDKVTAFSPFVGHFIYTRQKSIFVWSLQACLYACYHIHSLCSSTHYHQNIETVQLRINCKEQSVFVSV